ncbi:MAG: acyl-protein synthetase, partial [Gemmatimonadetes bacterium]|nr:acyl-protein synthetase [Gemmatimonadota bacterium]NIS02243.1 acyl-protein synthetase [Gemmatimonadota bacterium]NIT68069.1 acyl-protein synthetase [Gemmatimonadota bacterium]NIU53630.1 acyl-protein synthetase [Gemmatimonadota bacterium]NIW38033.1 acyl-protein synthetase [Gemmatimonadota bacterium]
YDNVLRERSLGRSPEMRFKVAPDWVRTQVVDAETLEPLPYGEVGVLRHYDLANLYSVMAVQTDDLGVAVEGGF